MCLILFAYRQHADYPLLLIANRDEFYARPTRDAHWWDETPVFAGRDLEAGGTWLGINRNGRFAAVTNVREAGGMSAGKKSRGALTSDFLSATVSAPDYLQALAPRDRDYAGFNLLLWDPQGFWFYSNRDHGIRRIEAGVYGVSNGSFDEPWPKLSSGKEELGAMLDGNRGIARHRAHAVEPLYPLARIRHPRLHRVDHRSPSTRRLQRAKLSRRRTPRRPATRNLHHRTRRWFRVKTNTLTCHPSTYRHLAIVASLQPQDSDAGSFLSIDARGRICFSKRTNPLNSCLAAIQVL
jgi:uncharacterized protein with NRDE domain